MGARLYICPMFKRGCGIFWIVLWLTGCYTFTGSTLPGHLKTIRVFPVEDKTLNPELAEQLTQALIDGFQGKSSLRIVADAGHSELMVKLKSYSHTAYNTSGASVLDYQINLGVEVQFYDKVKGKVLYQEQNLPGFATYSIQNGETETQGQRKAVEAVVNLILDNTVSGW